MLSQVALIAQQSWISVLSAAGLGRYTVALARAVLSPPDVLASPTKSIPEQNYFLHCTVSTFFPVRSTEGRHAVATPNRRNASCARSVVTLSVGVNVFLLPSLEHDLAASDFSS